MTNPIEKAFVRFSIRRPALMHAVKSRFPNFGAKAIENSTPEEVRKMWRKMSQMFRDVPAYSGTISDQSIAGPGGPLGIRIYMPPSKPKRALVYAHGGGMVIGDLESYDAVGRSISTAADAVVISVDYRLAPEHKFPSQPEDFYAALSWTHANAAALGIDPNRIAVGGDSAGGNLSAAISLMSRDKGGPKIAAQLLVYAGVDLTMSSASYERVGKGYLLTTAAVRHFWDLYLPDRSAANNPLASPLLASNHKDLPPAIVVLAGLDPLVDEARAYAGKLKSAGVPVEMKKFPNMMHGFWGFVGVVPECLEAHSWAGERLKTVLG